MTYVVCLFTYIVSFEHYSFQLWDIEYDRNFYYIKVLSSLLLREIDVSLKLAALDIDSLFSNHSLVFIL